MSCWWHRIILVWGFSQGPHMVPYPIQVWWQRWCYFNVIMNIFDREGLSDLFPATNAPKMCRTELFMEFTKRSGQPVSDLFKLILATEAKVRPGNITHLGQTNTSGHLYDMNTFNNHWHLITKPIFRGCLGHECPHSITCVHQNVSFETTNSANILKSMLKMPEIIHWVIGEGKKAAKHPFIHHSLFRWLVFG